MKCWAKSALPETGGAAGWYPLVPTVLATGSTASKIDLSGGTERYYRVTLLP